MVSNQQKWAKALVAFALFVCTAMLPAIAAPASAQEVVANNALNPDADFSIFIGRMDAMEYLGEPDGCAGAGQSTDPGEALMLCWHSVFDMTLTPIEYVGGNPDVGKTTFRVSQHAPYRSGAILFVYAKRDESGKWQILSRSSVELNACLDAKVDDDVTTVDENSPDWSVDYDDENRVCFSRLMTLQDQ